MPGHPDFQPVDPAVVPRFADIATFMRTRRHEISEAVDIGLVGVPFDIGLNYRSGARQGPAGVREASRVIRRVHPSSLIRPFEICNVADLGDAPVNPMNKDRSIEMIEGFFAELRRHEITAHRHRRRPHHPPADPARARRRPPVGVLHFDAHADTLDELCGDKVNHATFLRRGHEEGLVDASRVIQIGMRGQPLRRARHPVRLRRGLHHRHHGRVRGDGPGRGDREDRRGAGRRARCTSRSTSTVSTRPSSRAPACRRSAASSPRDAQVILRSLRGREIVGADISEVSPCFDPTGITCITVANLMFEMLCVIADGIASRRRGGREERPEADESDGGRVHPEIRPRLRPGEDGPYGGHRDAARLIPAKAARGNPSDGAGEISNTVISFDEPSRIVGPHVPVPGET